MKTIDWRIVAAITAIITAAATVALLFVADEGGGGPDVQNQNGVICIADEAHCYTLPDPQESDAQELLNEAARFADVPPEGEGPWPFAVAGSDIGLKVRSTNVLEAVQLGGIAELHSAWVDCVETTGFDPDPTTGVGPRWYRVRWAHQEPSDEFHQSDPGADTTAWAYAGYLVPVGHNGDVPAC